MTSESLTDLFLQSSGLNVGSGGGLHILDYVLSALNGLNSDRYVPNTKTCVNNTKYFQIDYMSFKNMYEDRERPMTVKEKETLLFNATAALSGYLPDAIYYCYFLPQVSYDTWTKHY